MTDDNLIQYNFLKQKIQQIPLKWSTRFFQVKSEMSAQLQLLNSVLLVHTPGWGSVLKMSVLGEETT